MSREVAHPESQASGFSLSYGPEIEDEANSLQLEFIIRQKLVQPYLL